MCGKTITVGQMKDNLSYLDRIADLLPPIRLQRLRDSTQGWFIVGGKLRHVLVCPDSPVRSHTAGFEGAHFDADWSQFLGKGFRESSPRPPARPVPAPRSPG